MPGCPKWAVAVVLLAGLSDWTLAADEDRVDKATFEAVCGSCHGAYMDTDLRSEEDWRDTIDQMISIGAKATSQQFVRVQRFLLHTYTKINVNTATAVQIAPVLGVPEASAQAVVSYRAAHGPFHTLDDLKKVPGLNAASLDARKDRIGF